MRGSAVFGDSCVTHAGECEGECDEQVEEEEEEDGKSTGKERYYATCPCAVLCCAVLPTRDDSCVHMCTIRRGV
jgi:hypothetical protein